VVWSAPGRTRDLGSRGRASAATDEQSQQPVGDADIGGPQLPVDALNPWRLFLKETGLTFAQFQRQVTLNDAVIRLHKVEPVTSIALDRRTLRE
jgi:methylphosphotriester-DNA--protein-cysteine methyltransferase